MCLSSARSALLLVERMRVRIESSGTWSNATHTPLGLIKVQGYAIEQGRSLNLATDSLRQVGYLCQWNEFRRCNSRLVADGQYHIAVSVSVRTLDKLHAER